MSQELKPCPFCGNESETRGYFWGENMLWGDNIYQGVRIGKEDGLCRLQTEFYDEIYHTSINFCPKCGRPLGTENSPDNWISVEDRLPTVNPRYGDIDVLVHMDDGFIATATFSGDWELWAESGEVTHWQPLPEPPKGDEN